MKEMSLLESLFNVNEYEMVESFFRSAALVKENLENNSKETTNND